MKRVLELPPAGGIHVRSNGRVQIDFADAEPGRVALELALLRVELCDMVVVRTTSGRHVVRLLRGQVPTNASAVWRDDRLELSLSSVALEGLLGFFLKYYRDGMADVDHVDLEARAPEVEGGIVDVMVRVGRSAPPVSGEEARKRLGL